MRIMSLVVGMLVALSAAAAVGPKRAKLDLAWVIKPWAGKDGNPHSRVSLMVNGKFYLVAADLGENLSILDRDMYEPCEIPKGALTACSGWFAGGGDKFYVVRKANSLWVYQQMGDCSPDSGLQPWRRVKTISIAKP